MRKCLPTSATELGSDGDGPSCSVVVNQTDAGIAGWRIDLYAKFADPGTALVRSITLTTATLAGSGTRVVMIVTIPGARGFSAVVRPPIPTPPNTDPIEVGLIVDATTAMPPTTLVP